MPEVLASTLHNKPVLSTDGREVGVVHNLTVRPQTGTLDTLLVEPNGSVFNKGETTEEGYLRIPAEAINGFDDHLMVAFPE